MITVGEEQVCCTPDRINAELVVKDLDGNVIMETAAGSEASLGATLNFNCNNNDDDPLTMLLEVRDSEGITKYLTYQQISSYPVKQIATSSSWIPGRPGECTVRFLYITCFSCSGIPSIEQYKITVY